MIHAAVSAFQSQPSIQCLHVASAHLTLDADAEPLSPDRGVPSAQVPGTRERHFGSPRERRMEQGTETGEKGDMGGVADRAAGRVGSDREIQADDAQETRQLVERRPWHKAALHQAHTRR
ncbi:MAG: hypothetical protein ACHQ15_06770 [Candidatus Limnocylindrales bacterium]